MSPLPGPFQDWIDHHQAELAALDITVVPYVELDESEHTFGHAPDWHQWAEQTKRMLEEGQPG